MLGGDAAFLISAMIVMIGLLQYTVGLFMITGDRGKMKAGAVLKNPVVLSVALGVLLYAANIPKPALPLRCFPPLEASTPRLPCCCWEPIWQRRI